jgi:hypothetical protein
LVKTRPSASFRLKRARSVTRSASRSSPKDSWIVRGKTPGRSPPRTRSVVREKGSGASGRRGQPPAEGSGRMPGVPGRNRPDEGNGRDGIDEGDDRPAHAVSDPLDRLAGRRLQGLGRDRPGRPGLDVPAKGLSSYAAIEAGTTRMRSGARAMMRPRDGDARKRHAPLGAPGPEENGGLLLAEVGGKRAESTDRAYAPRLRRGPTAVAGGGGVGREGRGTLRAACQRSGVRRETPKASRVASRPCFSKKWRISRRVWTSRGARPRTVPRRATRENPRMP